MCIVSVVYDYFQKRPIEIWDFESFDMFKEIRNKLAELDEKLGEKDCEDPAKAAWMKQVELRLTELEQAKKNHA